MPINFISVDRNKPVGAKLLSAIEALRHNQDELRQVKEILDNMTDGISYVDIETQLGIPTGKGDDIYNLVAGAVSELAADTNLTQLVDWAVPSL